jgi:hypothetical protein
VSLAPGLCDGRGYGRRAGKVFEEDLLPYSRLLNTIFEFQISKVEKVEENIREVGFLLRSLLFMLELAILYLATLLHPIELRSFVYAW